MTVNERRKIELRAQLDILVSLCFVEDADTWAALKIRELSKELKKSEAAVSLYQKRFRTKREG